MNQALLLLDICTIASAFVASVLWYKAGTRGVRRVSKEEVIDFQDFNRLVIAYNRSAVLNKRAALASAISALFVALRFLADMVYAA